MLLKYVHEVEKSTKRAFTYYVITFSQIFDPLPLCNQASSLSNPPPIIISTSCELTPSPPSLNKVYYFCF